MGQAALKAQVSRLEAATQNVEDSMVKVSHDREPLSFLDLPGEVRNIVYKLVFAKAKFYITKNRVNPAWIPSYTETDAEYFTTHVLRCNRSLLLTCKTIHAEAIPLISTAATLAIFRHHERKSPLDQVPTIHLQGIKSLEVEVHTFIWIPRELLPALQHVVLTQEATDYDGMLMHQLDCPACTSELDLVKEMVSDIQDWQWKRKQFVHIAKEEGFGIELLVRVNAVPDIHVTLTIDMEHRRLKQITVKDSADDKIDTYPSLRRYRQSTRQMLSRW